MFLARGLAAFGPEVRLVIGLVGAEFVDGRGAVNPCRAVISGLTRVIRREFPNLIARSVDLAAGGDQPTNTSIAALVNELCATTDEGQVAYRGQLRWCPDFISVPLSAVPCEDLPFAEEAFT